MSHDATERDHGDDRHGGGGPEDRDDLLDQLGTLQREEDALSEMLEAYVRGQRTREEILESCGEHDREEVEALLDSLQPLDAEREAAWVDRLAAALPKQPAANGAPRSGTRWWSLGLASAAGVALIWLLSQPPAPSTTPSAPLPEMAMTVLNETVRDTRSAAPTEATPRYRSESSIHWVLNRTTNGERDASIVLGARILAIGDEQGERRWIDPGAKPLGAQGSLEIAGTVGEVLGLPVGRWSLRVIIGERDALPDSLGAYDVGRRIGGVLGGDPWTVVDEYAYGPTRSAQTGAEYTLEVEPAR